MYALTDFLSFFLKSVCVPLHPPHGGHLGFKTGSQAIQIYDKCDPVLFRVNRRYARLLKNMCNFIITRFEQPKNDAVMEMRLAVRRIGYNM